jgi:ketosteroid isomerase-like protein
MSQANMEAIERGLDAFNRGDLATWIAVCDPEVENIPPREWPESAGTRGPEAIWEFFVDGASTWDEGAFEWGELIDAGPDRLVVNQRRQMRGKASGADVTWSYWVVFTFRGGRVLRFEWFRDRAEALEAAGLKE